MEIKKLKLWSRWILITFFLAAGLNHFVNPVFYYPIIPDYLPFPVLINYVSGVLELILAFGLIWARTRTYAAYLTIAMLIAFIPSHIYFIKMGACVGNDFCMPMWVAWLRLLVIHPLLIFWVWKSKK